MNSLCVRDRLLLAGITVFATFALAAMPVAAFASEASEVAPAEAPHVQADGLGEAEAPSTVADEEPPGTTDAQPSASTAEAPEAPAALDVPADEPVDEAAPAPETAGDAVPAPSPEPEIAEPSSEDAAPAVEAVGASNETVSPDNAAERSTAPVSPAAPARADAAPAQPRSQSGAITSVRLATQNTPGEAAADDPAKHPLADGTYVLSWAKSKKQIAASAKNSRKAGANALLTKDTGITRQRWTVKYLVEYGYYTIVNEYTKKALAVTAAKNKANVLQVKAKAGMPEQLWAIEKVGGKYVFHPASNAKLSLAGVSVKGGYNLLLRKNATEKDQQFLVRDYGIVHDGIYSVGLAKKSKKVVGVPGYSMKESKRLELSTYAGDLSQKFQMVRLSGDLYTLQSVHSGKYLGVSGSKVVQASNGADAAQQWRVVWNKTGLAFQNAKTGKCVEVPNASTKNGTKIASAASSNAVAQRFTLVERNVVDSGTYLVRSFAGDRALAVEDGSMAEYGNLDAETVGSKNNQKFRITRLKNGKYTIVSLKSELLAGAASKKSGANVRQRANHNSDLQRWEAQVAPGGGIQFVNVASGKVLDIAGTSGASGANVRLAKADGTAEQRWWLEKTSLNTDEAVVDVALRKAQRQGSSTKYFIAVDVSHHRTIILKRAGTSWAVEKNWLCSTGAPSTPTVLGTYTVGIKGYSFGDGYTCYYYTQFYGDYLFHSVKYYEGTFKVKDGRLGQDVSEGCVRLKLKNAKWIFNNIPGGTKVVTYK